jgi:hypothetical protein
MRSFLKILVITLFVVPVFVSLALVNYHITDDLRIQKILKQIELFRTKYKQQKIYLHSDKETYMAGETIWLKAYLMEATTLLPDSLGKDIYVDLIDFTNRQIRSIIIRNKQGFSNGDILLSDTLPEGKYQLRSYTNWMRNFDEDFFYNKTIEIKNPNYENIVTTHRLKEIKLFNRRFKKLEEKHVMTFFPEGGYLINGFQGKVAFKSENKLGQPVDITGRILDDKGTEITTFQSAHLGLGNFEYKPVKGKKYTAKVTYEGGKTEKFPLPVALDNGISMTVDPFEKDDILVTVFGNRSVSQNIASNEVIIVGQSRGMVLYVSKGELKDKPLVTRISKKLFPSGIVQITVFDGRNEPQCERLAFIDQETESDANEIAVTKTQDDDEITYEIEIVKPNGTPVKSNLSLSVQELTGKHKMTSENIFTNLLLTSDLKGRVDDPAYYFNPANKDAAKHLDLVMMSHGWRRFVWNDIMADRFPLLQYQPSEGLAIGGKITRDFFGIPVANSKVKLTVKDAYNDQFETLTDSHGNFNFQNLNYEDTINVKIEAFKPSGGKGVQIIVGDTIVPKISTKTDVSLLNIDFPKDKIKANNHRERMEFKKHYKGKPDPPNMDQKIHSTPNDVIYVKDDVDGYSNILQYMQGKVSGVTIMGNKVTIRGANSFYASTDPLFLVDGVPVDVGMVTSMNPKDIAIIEVLKGPECAIYGSRGANGVIAFYSRRGQFMKRGVIEFGMQGYYKAREFYVPNYAAWTYKPMENNVPRTLFWKPTIITDANGIATVKFKNKTDVEKFTLTIEGMTSNGEIIHYISEE